MKLNDGALHSQLNNVDINLSLILQNTVDNGFLINQEQNTPSG